MPGERSEFDGALHAAHRARRSGSRSATSLRARYSWGCRRRSISTTARPTLVEIAHNRLAGRGISLENERRAKAVLGDEAWAAPARQGAAAGPERAQDQADDAKRLVDVLEEDSVMVIEEFGERCDLILGEVQARRGRKA